MRGSAKDPKGKRLMVTSRQGVSIWGPLRFPPSRTLPSLRHYIYILKEGDRSELLEGPVNDPSTSRFVWMNTTAVSLPARLSPSIMLTFHSPLVTYFILFIYPFLPQTYLPTCDLFIHRDISLRSFLKQYMQSRGHQWVVSQQLSIIAHVSLTEEDVSDWKD